MKSVPDGVDDEVETVEDVAVGDAEHLDASEEILGWMKTIGGFRRTRFRGAVRTQLAAYFVGAAYNLLRMVRLLAA